MFIGDRHFVSITVGALGIDVSRTRDRLVAGTRPFTLGNKGSVALHRIWDATCIGAIEVLQVEPPSVGLHHLEHLSRPCNDRDAGRVEPVRSGPGRRANHDLVEGRQDQAPATFDINAP